ncbi:MAG: family 16 glycoside hydrolase, partial [Chloroflexota bacterium]
FSDVEITGRFRKVGGPPGGGYGIIIRDQEPQTRNGVNQAGHYYVLEAGEGTQWGAWRRDTDRWVELVPWTETKAVKMPPELNEVTVRAIGPRFTFIVNGTEIATIQDPALERGTVGIYVAGDGNEVEVEQYTVRAPQ